MTSMSLNLWMILALSVPAADPVGLSVHWGMESELWDTQTVWLQTPSQESRDLIAAELEKAGLPLAADRDSADTILIFDDSGSNQGLYLHPRSRFQKPARETLSPLGRGQAVRFLGPDIVIVLWEFEDIKITRLERFPASNFGRNFARLTKKVRSEREQLPDEF